MHAPAPLSFNAVLVAAMLLALVLTANFFRAVHRLDVRAHGRAPRVASWRRIAAFSVAAILPAASALAVIGMAPVLSAHVSTLASSCAATGFFSHQAMDAILRPRRG